MELHAALLNNLKSVNLQKMRIDTPQFGEVKLSKNSKQSALFLRAWRTACLDLSEALYQNIWWFRGDKSLDREGAVRSNSGSEPEPKRARSNMSGVKSPERNPQSPKATDRGVTIEHRSPLQAVAMTSKITFSTARRRSAGTSSTAPRHHRLPPKGLSRPPIRFHILILTFRPSPLIHPCTVLKRSSANASPWPIKSFKLVQEYVPTPFKISESGAFSAPSRTQPRTVPRRTFLNFGCSFDKTFRFNGRILVSPGHPWSDFLDLLEEFWSQIAPPVKDSRAAFQYFVNK